MPPGLSGNGKRSCLRMWNSEANQSPSVSPLARAVLLLIVVTLSAVTQALSAEIKLLNVSYDVTREFYQQFNPLFADYWKKKTGETVSISQSHGVSSKQARAVIDGLDADVVTMNQPLDIAILHEQGHLIPRDWASRLPNRSVRTPPRFCSRFARATQSAYGIGTT